MLPVNASFESPYMEYTRTIAAGAVYEVNQSFNCFRVLEITSGAQLSAVVGDQGAETTLIGQNLCVTSLAAYRRIRLINRGSAALTVRFCLAMGDVDYQDTSITADVRNTPVIPTRFTFDLEDITVPATSAVAMQGGSTYTEICNLLGNPGAVRVSASGSDSGAQLNIGERLRIDCSGQFFIYNPNASDVIIGLLGVD